MLGTAACCLLLKKRSSISEAFLKAPVPLSGVSSNSHEVQLVSNPLGNGGAHLNQASLGSGRLVYIKSVHGTYLACKPNDINPYMHVGEPDSSHIWTLRPTMNWKQGHAHIISSNNQYLTCRYIYLYVIPP